MVYLATALLAVACTSFLAYQAWEWQPPMNTLASEIRPLALVIIPLYGLALVVQISSHPLAWRVIRMLRRKERLAGGSAF